MNIENMLLVGSTARNMGKTLFCVEFIDKWRLSFDIICLKITTIRGKEGNCPRGALGCGVCSADIDRFIIVEEIDSSGGKDTQRMLAAGAKRVFWIRAYEEYILDAFNTFYSEIPQKAILVCESNALAKAVNPGVLVLAHNNGVQDIKPSAEALLDKSDFVADMVEPGNISAVLNKIKVEESCGKSVVSFNGAFKKATLIILAGGESRRMGTDKSALWYDGASFLERVVMNGRLCGFYEVIISGSSTKVPGARNVMDKLVGRGPLGGLHAGLCNAKTSYCVVVTVDVPKLDLDALIPMFDSHISSNKRATVLTTKGKLDPLIGVYNTDLHADIYDLIKYGPKRIIELLDNVCYSKFEFTGEYRMLDNINTPNDYNKLLSESDSRATESD